MNAQITAEATEVATPTVEEQAGALLGQVAGYVGHRIIGIGLERGLLARLAQTGPLTSDQLADALGLDAFYTSVWCRGALATGVLDRDGDAYRLAPHIDTLLLDPGSPRFVGGLFPLFQQPEMFDRFGRELDTGERLWWDQTSPDWIAGVAVTGRPFYSRLIPGGLDRIPGLGERLAAGCRVVDSACGAGVGVVALAEQYPGCDVVGIDGDEASVDRARVAVRSAGVDDRVTLQVSPLERMRINGTATVVINNISMHECRDIDEVTRRVVEMLEPGGWFVISDFPFPDTDAGLRTTPGRIMSGIQLFEAQIDDQLLPRAAYDALLERHGFDRIEHVQLTPVHAVTWGRVPERR